MNETRPIRVLHVIHWPVSGITSLFKNVIPLMPGDVESHIIFFHYEKKTLDEFGNICKTAHCLDLSRSPASLFFKYKNIIRETSPDILHTHSFLPMALGTVFTLGGRRHINTVHSDYPYFFGRDLKSRLKRTVQKNFLNWFGIRAVAVSKSVYRTLAGIGVSGKNLILIENGVDTSCAEPPRQAVEEARAEFESKKGDIHIITLGRLDKLKGYDFLLKAFKELSQRHPNTVLIFVGDGQEMPYLKGLARDLRIDERVRFLGYKSNPLAYLSAADIFVCSSTTEGFSLAVTEAMLCRLPVVATRVGVVPELVEDGVSGYIVESGDHIALAAAIEKAVSRPDKKEMGKKGRRKVVENFDIRKTAGRYHDLYRSLCEKGRLS